MLTRSDYLNISIYLSQGVLAGRFGLVITSFMGPVIKQLFSSG